MTPAYLIRGLCPRTDIDMGCHGFCIDLSRNWRDAVTASGITQEKVNHLLKVNGRAWLDSCKFDSIFDPDNCGHAQNRNLPPGPNARPMYQPLRDLRVTWGEFGPEHITVPGNACGLDIERRSFGSFLGGPSLLPHNIDSWHQKNLLLIVFCEIAESIALFARNKE